MALQSLNDTLAGVRQTVNGLIAVADEQYAAATAGDVARLEAITQQQEQLSAQLAQVEQRRMALTEGASLRDLYANGLAAGDTELTNLITTIEESVQALRTRNDRNVALLEKAADLAGQTVRFLHQLVTDHVQPYDERGARPVAQSLLVDSRA